MRNLSWTLLAFLGALLMNRIWIGPEDSIYRAFALSVVEDGDLNTLNQLVDPKRKVRVTQTFNLPQFHNHGAVIVWAPILLIGRTLSRLGFVAHDDAWLSMSTWLCVLCSLALTICLCSQYFSRTIALTATAAIFLGSPVFYYSLFRPGNANGVALLFSSITVLYASTLNRDRLGWFVYGILLSLCFIVKVDAWFQFPPAIAWWLWNFVTKRVSLETLGYLALGFTPGAFLKLTNDWLTYGEFYWGELSVLNLSGNYLWEQCFSRYRGFFYTSPILAVGLLGGAIGIRNAMRSSNNNGGDVFASLLMGSVVVKIIIISFRFAWGGGTGGARILMTELPIFALGLGYLLNHGRLWSLQLLIPMGLAAILWNALALFEFSRGTDMNYIIGDWQIGARVRLLLELWKDPAVLARARELFKLGPFWFVGGGITFLLVSVVQRIRMRSFIPVALGSYIVITGLNLYNNSRSADRYSHTYPRALISHDGFADAENHASIREMAEYFRLIGELERSASLDAEADRINKVRG